MKTAANARNQRKTELPFEQRLAFTPNQFAQLFGRHQVWAYRLIYARKVKVIADSGRMMIPRAEADRLTKRAAFYNGK
jgi:hypothetical protein